MRRAGAIAAVALSCLLVPNAAAEPKPQLTDPAGDYPVAGADIVSALFTTVKKTKLVVVVQFSGPPSAPPPHAYQLRFNTDEGCTWRGNYFGEQLGSSGGCSTTDASPPAVVVKGNTIVFTMAAKGALKPGVELSEIAVTTTPGGVLAGLPAGDTAVTDATYVIGK